MRKAAPLILGLVVCSLLSREVFPNSCRDLVRHSPDTRRSLFFRVLVAGALLSARASHADTIENVSQPQQTEFFINECALPEIGGLEPCGITRVKTTWEVDTFDSQKQDSILGGEREVTGAEIRALPSATVLEHRGYESAMVVWDGMDNNPIVDKTGLGEIDFQRDNGDRFVVRVQSATTPGQLIVTVYGGRGVSRGVIRYEKSAVMDYHLPFLSMRPLEKTEEADFSKVGAVVLQILPDAWSPTTNPCAPCPEFPIVGIDSLAVASAECAPCLSGGVGPGTLLDRTLTAPTSISTMPELPLVPPTFDPTLPLLFFGSGNCSGASCTPYSPPPDDGGGGVTPPVSEPSALTITVLGVLTLSGYRIAVGRRIVR